MLRGIPDERLQIRPGVDGHPNEIAHRIAAESLYAWLEKEQLVLAENFVHWKKEKRIQMRLDEIQPKKTDNPWFNKLASESALPPAIN